MKTYGIGTRVFCDFHFSGKPKGKVVAVNKPGNGKDSAGEVVVELTETVRAYKKGERLTLSTYYAVPLECVLPVKPGQFFTRISTLYEFR